MALEFSISGGTVRIPKKLFIREMLGASSPLKALLDYELEADGKRRVLTVDRSSDADAVVIDFSSGSDVPVGEDFSALISALKAKHRGAVTGRVVLTAFCYNTMVVELDLSSDDGEVKTIHR